ncbi:MAG: hypothetical protein HFI93_05705 [Lachnospiraceae bacterium]|nr:hypothetical protein [Lachnospiraceae bacterium]
MKKLTSVTLHTTSEGQRASYTFSEIDENTGAIRSDNNRSSMVILEIPANEDMLLHIEAVKAYVEEKMGQ